MNRLLASLRVGNHDSAAVFPDYSGPVSSDYRLLTFLDRNPAKPETETDKMRKVTSDTQ